MHCDRDVLLFALPHAMEMEFLISGIQVVLSGNPNDSIVTYFMLGETLNLANLAQSRWWW